MENRHASDKNTNSKILSLEKDLKLLHKKLDEKLGKIKGRFSEFGEKDAFSVLSLEKAIRFFQRELAKQRAGLRFGMEQGKERFEQELLRLHKELKISAWKYIKKYGISATATAPIIYFGIFPTVLLDAFVTFCRYLCFRAFGISIGERNRYFVFERMYLDYLNFIQKVNCAYCSYGNGTVAYAGESLAKTENLWLPEKQRNINAWNFIKNADTCAIIAGLILYLGIFVFVLFDAFVTFYQHTCFRAYKIPTVKRGVFFTFEKTKLRGLNFIQKWNYMYGSYAKGVMAYVKIIYAETERFWCPIKHAKKTLGYHDLYDEFAEYGKAEEFFQKYMKALREEDASVK